MDMEEIARAVEVEEKGADTAMGEDVKRARTPECIASLFKFLSVLSVKFYPKSFRDCR